MPLNQVVKQLKTFSQTNTIRHSGITFVGTAVNGILGIVYFFYLASKISPDSFGHFMVSVGLISVGFSIFNFGLDQSIVKFKGDANILANILFIKISLFFLLTIFPLVYFGIQNIFSLIGLGIGGQMLFSFATSFLQSQNKFVSWSSYFVTTNLVRLVAAYFMPSTSPYIHLLIYSLIPLIGFKIFYLLNLSTLPKPKFDKQVVSRLWQFNTHLSLTSIISALTSKLDSFFIAGFQSFAAAGIYSLAMQLSSSVSQLSSAYSAVISPKFTSLNTPDKNSQYLKKNLWLSSLTSLLLVFILFITGYFLNLPGVLLLLLVSGFAIFFTSIPLRESLLYYFGDSKIFLNLSVFSFLFSVFSGFLLIRPFGSLAAAASFLVVQIISVIILTNRYATQNRRS